MSRFFLGFSYRDGEFCRFLGFMHIFCRVGRFYSGLEFRTCFHRFLRFYCLEGVCIGFVRLVEFHVGF